MPGLVPGIHVFVPVGAKDVDGRDKPGHDEERQRGLSPSLRAQRSNPCRSPWLDGLLRCARDDADGLARIADCSRAADEDCAGPLKSGHDGATAVRPAPSLSAPVRISRNRNPGATVQPTSVQSPSAFGGLPGPGGTIACGCSPAARSAPSVTLRCPSSSAISSVSGAAGVIVPDLGGIDAVPVRALAARQQEIDRGRGGAAVGVHALHRERSRDSGRLPDAA